MRNLRHNRERFLQDMRAKTNRKLATEFEKVLDDFIAWSEGRPELLYPSDKLYKQAVLSFQRVGDDAVFWSAYPQTNDDTKLAILPHSDRSMAKSLKSEVRAVIRELTDGTVNEEGVFQIRFRYLLEAQDRERVKVLLEKLLVEHMRK